MVRVDHGRGDVGVACYLLRLLERVQPAPVRPLGGLDRVEIRKPLGVDISGYQQGIVVVIDCRERPCNVDFGMVIWPLFSAIAIGPIRQFQVLCLHSDLRLFQAIL